MNKHSSRHATWVLALALLPTLLCLPVTGFTAVDNSAIPGIDSPWLWNLLIAAFVLLVTAASAALPCSAIRQWRGGWRLAAVAPLVVLLLWLGIIILSTTMTTGSHDLWPLEIFAWAMMNMIYMVSIMTVKRNFAKADEDSSTSN